MKLIRGQKVQVNNSCGVFIKYSNDVPGYCFVMVSPSNPFGVACNVKDVVKV